ncbi:hypothetical protein RhiJN_25057 [Ceratobasidium sp. AG-Ba]|nr:hypothetical protein RhiJN_25057 [Ceratobasidium sp. AG-Ba]
MIVTESQPNSSKLSVSNDQPLIDLNEPLNPPPYPSTSFTEAQSESIHQRPCNYLLNHKAEGSIKGIWTVDTSLSIPESILPPITEYDGRWNKDLKEARKDKKPLPSEVRPNLMFMCNDGSIKADVHISPSKGGPAMIVAESKDGCVDLVVDVPAGQVARINAFSSDGQVKVWIPSTFEAALTIGTSDGSVNISDSIRAKLTTFYSKSNHSRCFIGDWQSSGFGVAQSGGDSSPPAVEDPFMNWSGSTIRIDSKDGSVSIGLISEKPLPKPEKHEPNPFMTFMSGLFGRRTSTAPQNTGTVPESEAGPSNARGQEGWPNDREVLPSPAAANVA